MKSYSIQKILVPIDLSDTSLNALNAAVNLAKLHDAKIIILNVVETLASINQMNGFPSFNVRKSADILSALLAAMEHTNEIRPELIQVDGNVVESILSTSTNYKADLVVIGTHGASGFRDGFLGSNSYNTIKYCACPVLTIPGRRKIKSFKKALFPIRPVSGALTCYDIASHFLESQSTLEVLGLSHIKTQNQTGVLDRIVDEIRVQLERDRVKTITFWGKHFSIYEDIIDYVQQNQPDLIVLTSSIDAISKANFIGPYTQKIINCVQAPILTVKKLGIPVLA